MDTQRGDLSLAVFGVLLVAALVIVPLSGALLPATVASHFGANGEPNGFMARSSYVMVMSATAVGVPLVMVASIAWRVERRAQRLKIPNRAYWLADERRAESAAYITLHTTRFASILIVFLVLVHGLVVRANLLHPPRLDLVPMIALATVFVLATALWLRALYARFALPAGAAAQRRQR